MIEACVLFLSALLYSAGAQAPACSTADQCRRETQQAIASGDFERAHDLAWLAYQKGRRQDPETLALLARSQSLSGRADDAYVMLRRLAETGVTVDDIATSDDFQRVRNHPQWPELIAAYERIAAARVPEPTAPVVPAIPEPKAAPALATAPPTPAEPTAVLASEDLAMPALSFTPAALAYDAVSARFILSAGASDALTVLSQTSNNAAPLTSRGWSGLDKTTAIAIDRVAGDLWVAVYGEPGAALHRLQLISGRRLEVIEPPNDLPAELIALAATRDGLFALDRAGRRVLRRTSRQKSLVHFAALPPDASPIALADARTALFVAHAAGVLRIDLATRRSRALTAPDRTTLIGLHSIAWHDGVLVAIQSADRQHRVVRLRLNAAGTRVTRTETLGPAASDAATLSAGVYYYFAIDSHGARVLRAIAAK